MADHVAPSNNPFAYSPAGIAKAIAALLTGVATWGGTAIADGHIDGVEWFGLVGVVAAVVAVFGVTNRPPGPVVPADDDPAHPDAGESPIGVVLGILAIVVLVLLLARLL